MKLLHLTIALAFSTTALFAADVALPPELSAARARFDAALTTATKPVRDRYVAELQQIKNRAISAKNLELAVAVDQEIKSVSAATTSTKAVAAGKPLNELLPGTKWLPERPDAKWKSIEFTSDGQVVRTALSGKANRDAYLIPKDGDSVTFKWSDGSNATLRFSRGNRQFEFEGATYKPAQDQ